LLGLLTGAIVTAVGEPIDRETVLLLVLLFVVAICCYCFEVVVALAAAVVFGIPHICDSVVLTTLRLGLLGLHIFALSSADIVVVLSEPLLLLPAAGRGDDDDGDDNCCANT
jgi:hypothetical protein